jgi:PAS domain S-box-containing protein
MKLKELLKKVGLDAAQIYDVVPSAVFTVDKKKRITSWNKRAAEITGYTLEDVLGESCLTLGGEGCRSKCRLFSEGEPKPIRAMSCDIKTKGGETKKISKSLDVLRDKKGVIIGAVESFEDITERIKAEEIMRKRADILNFIDHPIYVVDRNLAYLFCNNKLISRLNLSSLDEIIGKTYGEFHTKEQAEEFAQKVEEVFATGETLRYEYESQRGEIRKYKRTLSPNTNFEGKVVSVTISSDDISAIMHGEQGQLITICAYCKKIKNKKNRWMALEAYFADKIDLKFSHGMCPNCSEEAYKELKLLKQHPPKKDEMQEL